MKYSFLLLFIILITFSAKSQIGINTPNPDASAVMDVNSTSKGMLIPRITPAQRTAIPNPATGLLVFDITKHSIITFLNIE